MTGGIDFGAARDPRAPARGADRVRRARGAAARTGGRAAAGRSSTSPAPARSCSTQNAGVLDPDRAIAAMLRLATANGADIRFDTRVTRLDARAATARSCTPAARTFTAPGRSSSRPAPGSRRCSTASSELPPLTVTQQQVFHFAPAPGQASAASRQRPASRGRSSSSQDEQRLLLRPARRPGRRGARRDQGRRAHPGTVTTAAGRDFRVDPARRDRVRRLRRAGGCPASTRPRSTR